MGEIQFRVHLHVPSMSPFLWTAPLIFSTAPEGCIEPILKDTKTAILGVNQPFRFRVLFRHSNKNIKELRKGMQNRHHFRGFNETLNINGLFTQSKSEKDQRISNKPQRKFSLSLSLSLGVNRP